MLPATSSASAGSLPSTDHNSTRRNLRAKPIPAPPQDRASCAQARTQLGRKCAHRALARAVSARSLLSVCAMMMQLDCEKFAIFSAKGLTKASKAQVKNQPPAPYPRGLPSALPAMGQARCTAGVHHLRAPTGVPSHTCANLPQKTQHPGAARHAPATDTRVHPSE